MRAFSRKAFSSAASLLEHVDLEALRRFRLGGDYFLWTQLAKSTELHTVMSFLGAFRVHKGQLSEGLEAYRKEAMTCTRPERLSRKGDSLLGIPQLAFAKRCALEFYARTIRGSHILVR